MKHIRILIFLSLILTSCHYDHPQLNQNWDLSQAQQDSLQFAVTHHYTVNSNFYVTSDSLCLMVYPPESIDKLGSQDSCVVHEDDKLVVADILTVPDDSAHQPVYYIKVAHNQETMGWVNEETFLDSTVPCDPISQFIHAFSNRHIVYFCFLLGLAAIFSLHRLLRRKGLPFVHFNDIDSLYPSLFCLDTAIAATLYGSMQAFVPETWKEFYFNPTINPFGQPFILAAFLLCVWLMLITFIASLEDIRQQLKRSDAITYILGLACIWLVIYLLFSQTVRFFIAFPLLLFYIWFTLRIYLRRHTAKYICGRCGKPIHHLGRCPHCGAINK